MAKLNSCKWQCGKSYVNLRDLTEHYKVCPNKPKVTPAPKKKIVVECRCGKQFTSRSTYNQHAQTCKKAR